METAKSVEKKGGDFVEVQKLRGQKRDCQLELEKQYRELGERLYSQYKNGEPLAEELAARCKEIEGLKQKITGLKNQIAVRKGQRICQNCGAPVPQEAAFCMRCGAAMPEEEEDFTDAEFEEAESLFEEEEEVSEEPETVEAPEAEPEVPSEENE